MRIWISGAGGFAGHHLVQHVLTNTDWDIIATDSFRHKGTTDRLAILFDWNPEWRKRVDVITHDLTAPFSEQAMDRMGDFDFLVAMASESHVDRSITDPVPFVQNNVSVILNTLELARLRKPRKVLVISTDEVYGSVSDPAAGHREWDPPVPSNPYSASKAAQEAISIAYWRTYQVPIIITNSVNMFGERQDPEKYISMLIRKIARDQKVTVHGGNNDIGSRFYIHARNAADAWLFLLQNRTPMMFPQREWPDKYNISSLEPVNNLEMARLVAKFVGTGLRYELVDFHSARPGHDPHYGLNSEKIRQLGWQSPVDFEDSLERTVKWTLDNPSWML